MMLFSATTRLCSPSSSSLSKPSIYTRFFPIPRPRICLAASVSSSSKSIISTTPPSSGATTLPVGPRGEPTMETACFPGTLIEITPERVFFPPRTDPAALQTKLKMLMGSNIALSDYATDAEVREAEFVKSSLGIEDCPDERLPEFAFVGRSNVGKSSLLNSVVRRRKLALTSKKPGKTRMINHFRINNSWFLVDLPGYGYANVPIAVRKDWEEFTRNYFLKCSTLVAVFLLIDASVPAKTSDLNYARWLSENQIPMTLIFTKCDKRKKRKTGGKSAGENVQLFLELMGRSFEKTLPWIMTSSHTHHGRDEILLHMAQLRNYWLHH